MLSKTIQDKVGNTLIYFTNRLGNIYLTKAIKLLYLADELSVIETGVPFTWLDYKAWKNGPVPEDLHSELRYKINNVNYNSPFSNFVKVEKVTNPVTPEMESFIISSISEFNDDEFSDYDVSLLDRIIEKYGNLSGNDLITILHKEGSLWDTVVKENDLDLAFKLRGNKSDFSIPFTKLLHGNELKQIAYKSAYSSILMSERLSS